MSTGPASRAKGAARRRGHFRVTRFGKPLADVVQPRAEAPRGSWLGAMRGRARITGEIVTPVEGADAWKALR